MSVFFDRVTAVLAVLIYGLALTCAQSSIANSQELTIGQKHDADILKRFPPPGKMIDIGGRKLHLHCKGAAIKANDPTVILEAGAFGSSVWYRAAQDEVAKIAHVCTYDRAGLAWSEPVTLPRPLEARADDLHLLLKSSGMKGPFILVGHSMGGLLVRMTAQKYPQDIAGIVTMDSSVEEVNALPDSVERSIASARQLDPAIGAIMQGIEIPQLRFPGLPPEQDIIQRESVFRAGQDDLLAMSKLPEALAKHGGKIDIGKIPLVVVRRGIPDKGMSEEFNHRWVLAQESLVKRSARAVLLVAEKSGHNVMIDEPTKYAEAVAKVLSMR
jgi:pimeloyl-ACP methyl ester carboxylesterase